MRRFKYRWTWNVLGSLKFLSELTATSRARGFGNSWSCHVPFQASLGLERIRLAQILE